MRQRPTSPTANAEADHGRAMLRRRAVAQQLSAGAAVAEESALADRLAGGGARRVRTRPPPLGDRGSVVGAPTRPPKAGGPAASSLGT